jgi:hypothetical protein
MRLFLMIVVLRCACSAQTPKPVIDWKYIALNGANAGAAGLDLWSTHHLLATGRYKEGNPLMPRTVAGQAGVDAGIIAGAAWSSWYLKKHGSKWWLLAPVVGIGAHGFGATWNLTR